MPGYIKFDGVDGESKDSSHEKWIDVLSVDWGTTQGAAIRPQVQTTTFGLPTP